MAKRRPQIMPAVRVNPHSEAFFATPQGAQWLRRALAKRDADNAKLKERRNG